MPWTQVEDYAAGTDAPKKYNIPGRNNCIISVI